VTGLLSTCGLQFQDWSAAYRLFSQPRLSTGHLFTGVRTAAAALIPDSEPLCISMDDSLFRKTGTKIHGVGWRRDPLGPKFQVNLVRAQRFLQFSLAVPHSEHSPAVRMIPIDFLHCPTAVRPRKNASEEEQAQYRQAQRVMNLSSQASTRLAALCAGLPKISQQQPRPVHLLVDGQYTNRTVLKHLPAQTTLLGRIRKDAKLYYLPTPATEAGPRGRRRQYGTLAPTPEQIRTADQHPWQTISVFACGAQHDCRVKVVTGLLWRTAGASRLLKLVVIAPLHYRLRAGSKLLYRQPAFLICTDPAVDTQQIVQQYMWRWDIEVNFREEKSLLGVGQAQVRTPESNQSLPAFLIATYALLLLAAMRATPQQSPETLLPRSKWSARLKPQRTSTQRLIHHLQAEVWGRGIGVYHNFSHFSPPVAASAKPEKLTSSLSSALLYCNV
jgi:hypothetical protein